MVKFKTFRIVVALVAVVGLFGFSRIACGPSPAKTQVPVAQNNTYTPPPVVQYVPVQQAPVYNPPPVVQYVPVVQQAAVYTPPPQVRASTNELKQKLGAWLTTNQYRHGKKS